VDTRLLNSLLTLNYHELFPVVAPTHLSLEDPRLVMAGLRTCHADRGRQPVFRLSSILEASGQDLISWSQFFINRANGWEVQTGVGIPGQIEMGPTDERRLLRTE
jgi:hypothetical protein